MSQEVKRAGVLVAHSALEDRQLVQRSGVLVAHSALEDRQLVQRSGVLVAFWENPDPVIHEFKNVESDLSGHTTLAVWLHTNNNVSAALSGHTTLAARVTMGADVEAHLSGATTFGAVLDVDDPLWPSAFSGSTSLQATLSAGFYADLSGHTDLGATIEMVVTRYTSTHLMVDGSIPAVHTSWDEDANPLALIVFSGTSSRNRSF